MWSQRIFGMEYAFSQPDHSRYLLATDDDIEFEADFAESLIRIAEEHKADTLVPIRDYRRPKLTNLISGILGERTENSSSRFKITIKRNGRFSVNNSLAGNVNPTQSGLFQCFLMRTDITPSLGLRDEMWLDETRYSLPDDQVFFYKAYILGLNTLSCKKPEFRHLDGKAGTTSRDRVLDMDYSAARNISIFWHRFILPKQNGFCSKTMTRLSFGYYVRINQLKYAVLGIVRRDWSHYRQYMRGIRDARTFIAGK